VEVKPDGISDQHHPHQHHLALWEIDSGFKKQFLISIQAIHSE
jgi:hypothetical protein